MKVHSSPFFPWNIFLKTANTDAINFVIQTI